MYGICGENDYGKATCSYNGSAIALEDENALEILQEICPHVIRGMCNYFVSQNGFLTHLNTSFPVCKFYVLFISLISLTYCLDYE